MRGELRLHQIGVLPVFLMAHQTVFELDMRHARRPSQRNTWHGTGQHFAHIASHRNSLDRVAGRKRRQLAGSGILGNNKPPAPAEPATYKNSPRQSRKRIAIYCKGIRGKTQDADAERFLLVGRIFVKRKRTRRKAVLVKLDYSRRAEPILTSPVYLFRSKPAE
ncbi:hypothetical protein [Bradyrhizobium genosp. SA-3]|uniref:hypothetical protein n=1 Tax=Bradyrhizobium genosp. SA-3 TaxID=508868 RepID=UPI001FE08FE9|nr:hypothetical protein [Bradyrhizobium genosp. SA-3]